MTYLRFGRADKIDWGDGEIELTHKGMQKLRKSKELRALRNEFVKENTHVTHCQRCNRPFPEWDHSKSFTANNKGRSVDHVIPISRDHTKALEKSNLQLLCNPCNMYKSDLTPDELETWERLEEQGIIQKYWDKTNNDKPKSGALAKIEAKEKFREAAIKFNENKKLGEQRQQAQRDSDWHDFNSQCM